MGRKKLGERVGGPYRKGEDGYRVIIFGPPDAEGESARIDHTFASEGEANDFAEEARADLADRSAKSIKDAMTEYEVFMRVDKGNKPRSVDDAMLRLRQFFPNLHVNVRTLKASQCQAHYDRIVPKYAVDTHRSILAGAKTFLHWCMGKGYVTANPCDGVKGKGRRKHGKAQLTIDEARTWLRVASTRMDGGHDGAIAACAALLLGLRASEIVSVKVRDVDDGGRLLWIRDAKTPKGKRQVEVPEILQAPLVKLAEGRDPNAWLFQGRSTASGRYQTGHKDRDWVREWVVRICTEAKVNVVTAHGMRGLHATLAMEHGATGHIVAQSLGHESVSTTTTSYARKDAVSRGEQRKVMKVIDGGKK